jgi:transcriptional regulator with XRE-family HTH domain
MPTNSPSDVDQRIARRLGELRTERGLTLEALAARSAVSRSMISKIERGEVSPTAVVLNKLAIGLGVLLPTLFGYSVQGPPRPLHPVARLKDQQRWKDPDSGYQRRTLTPPGVPHNTRLSEIHFPPAARVTFENAFGRNAPQQQIWMLKGEMSITLGDTRRRLAAGDCMAMTLDAPITFHNPGRTMAHYLVAITQ